MLCSDIENYNVDQLIEWHIIRINYSGCENSLLLNEVAETGWIFSIFTHSVKYYPFLSYSNH